MDVGMSAGSENQRCASNFHRGHYGHVKIRFLMTSHDRSIGALGWVVVSRIRLLLLQLQ